MAKLDEQIATLQDRLTQLKVRQQRIDTRKRAMDALRERKAETRRRILLGALIIEKSRSGELDPVLLRSWLDQALTRSADRALFDLPAAAGAPPAPGDV